MTDPLDSLLIDVRANTQGFAQDVAQLRASFDGTLVEGFARAGGVLERSLLAALRRSGDGFGDLRRIALSVIEAIAGRAGALGAGVPGGAGGCFPALRCGCGGGGLGAGLAAGGDLVLSLLGLPGRATGGPVAPGRSYRVGENGPELFVPTSAGRIEPAGGGAREVRVAITVKAPAGTDGPRALELSSRQVASAVRRALRDA